jgi:hypothetical protein
MTQLATGTHHTRNTSHSCIKRTSPNVSLSVLRCLGLATLGQLSHLIHTAHMHIHATSSVTTCHHAAHATTSHLEGSHSTRRQVRTIVTHASHLHVLHTITISVSSVQRTRNTLLGGHGACHNRVQSHTTTNVSKDRYPAGLMDTRVARSSSHDSHLPHPAPTYPATPQPRTTDTVTNGRASKQAARHSRTPQPHATARGFQK